MTDDFGNPFADYGGIVYGKRFIGRQDDLRAVENRSIRPSEPGNLAIIGDSRVGKSSLVHQAVLEQKERLLKKKQIPVWINLGTFDTGVHLFRSLVTDCFDELEDLEWLTEPIVNAKNRALHEELSWSVEYSRIQRFFQRIRQAGYRILFILDEFDHARYLFQNDISGFQGLRELSYRPEWRVTFITISRRTLRDIELQTRAISTFDLIFHKHYLSMFHDQEMQEFYGKLTEIGLQITDDTRSKFRFYCGGHPYLLDVLGYEAVEQYRENNDLDLDKAAHRVEHTFLGHYDHIAEILDEDKSLNRLLQILFGPVVDVKPSDVDELLRYGFIRELHNGNYITFSDHFQTYLQLLERKADLWPIWRETEIALRNAINVSMKDCYGEDWISDLEKRHRNKVKPIFQKCREAQKKEEKSFEGRASRNLLDFTYPRDLFDILFAEWNVFGSIFKKDKNYWEQRAQLLAKVRNPLAHNRDWVLYEHDLQIAEGYCKEILNVLAA